jgi:hypothetical protein
MQAKIDAGRVSTAGNPIAIWNHSARSQCRAQGWQHVANRPVAEDDIKRATDVLECRGWLSYHDGVSWTSLSHEAEVDRNQCDDWPHDKAPGFVE